MQSLKKLKLKPFSRLIHLFGLMLFLVSFFVPTVPNEMTTGEGSEVKAWQSPATSHMRLALEPFMRVNDFISARNDPSEYGYGQGGDGYEVYLEESVERSIYSIPASIGWFVIWLSVLLGRQLWSQSMTHRALRHMMVAGGVVMLFAVPLLSMDFYTGATTYKGYFHLGSGAYLIVAAYLFTGASILLLLTSTRNAEQGMPADAPQTARR